MKIGKMAIVFIMSLFISTVCSAQGGSYVWNVPPAPTDGDFITSGVSGPCYVTTTYTVTNTGSDTVHVKLGPGAENYLYQSVTFGIDITNVSGTQAGTVTLYGSNEAGTATKGFKSIATVSVTTVTPTYWNNVVTGNPYTNYWLVYTGAGTMVSTFIATLLLR